MHVSGGQVAKSYERAPWTHIVGRNTQTSLKFQEN